MKNFHETKIIIKCICLMPSVEPIAEYLNIDSQLYLTQFFVIFFFFYLKYTEYKKISFNF